MMQGTINIKNINEYTQTQNVEKKIYWKRGKNTQIIDKLVVSENKIFNKK